ncbi:MAG: AsmA family protein [Alphaproteobacteria bacterium]|nr:AsmA family protein [Alphaproteobacteria bacterium]
MLRKNIAIALAGALAVVIASGVLLRPEAGPAADRLAAEISAQTGLPAHAAPGARFDWTWPLRLEVPAIEIADVGRLDGIVAQSGRFVAAARIFGHAGAVKSADGALTFAGDGLSARIDRTDGLTAETTLAGQTLRIAGRPTRAGLDALAIDWQGLRLQGSARWDETHAALAVEVANSGSRLAGMARPSDGTFEGTLDTTVVSLGRARGELRATADAVDFARFEVEGQGVKADGSARIEVARAALDIRFADAPFAVVAGLVADTLGRPGDVDLRVRAGRLAWPAGEAQGVILVAARENGKLVLDELAVRSIAEASVRVRDGIVDLAAPDAARFLAALGVTTRRHLGALALRGGFAMDPAAGSLRAEPVEIELAGQRLKGTAEWRAGRLKADLAGERVSLDPFFGAPLAKPVVRGPILTRSQQKRAAAATAPPPPGAGGWSRVPFLPDLVGGIPLDLSLSARELVFSALDLRDARLVLAADAGGFDIGELSGSLFGGALSAAGHVGVATAPKFDLRVALAGAELARVLASAGAPPLARGPVSFKGQIASSGVTPAEMAAGLSGNLAIDSPGGTLEGVDLAGLLAYARSATTPDLAELGRRLAHGANGRFTKASGNWTLERGIARTDDTRFEAPGGALALSGIFDLANWRVDLGGTLAAAGARQVPHVSIAGPPGRPNVKLGFSAPSGGAAKPADPGARRKAPSPRR